MTGHEAMYQEILNALRKAGRVLVIADQSPDGDCVGASTAMYRWLKREGKDVTLFHNGEIPACFRFIDGYYDFTSDETVFDRHHDAIVTLDGGSLEHLGINELLDRTPKGHAFINIDHHTTNERFGDVNLVDTGACSTCEVVYHFLKYAGIEFDDKIATSLLTGLYTDTGHFQNPLTNVSGVEAASKLCRYGARHNDIIKHLVANKSMTSLKALGIALERLSYDKETDVAVTYYLKEDIEKFKDSMDAFERISNFINATCSEADTILVLKEFPGYVKGSLRSASGDILNLAEALGGGGHKKAAGFQIPGRIVEENGKPRILPEGELDDKAKEGLKSLALYPLDC